MTGGEIRVGIGYDIHPFVKDRKLILGGVEISHEKGLAGWSDADVLIHAVIDALLGAASLGDIGRLFPAGVPEYQNVSSVSLLVRVKELLEARGWEVGNIDANLVAEQPRLSGVLKNMRDSLAKILSLDEDKVSVKAKSGNGVGELGHGEGIAAQAIALIHKVPQKNERRKL